VTFKTVLAALALAALPTVALAATDDELRQQIVGTWGPAEGCADGALTFNADGTYAIIRTDDDPESGTWSISEGVITASDQRPSTVTIEGNKLMFGDPEGGPRNETFTRCPE
jgi:hypothetical protein